MNCPICVEPFNRSTRSRVTCGACKTEACSGCTETYLCSTLDDAHCMSCRAGWTREMLETCGLSKKFVRDTFKKRREEVLFERERAQMPATQPLVEREILIRRFTKQQEELRVQYAELYAQANRYNNSTTLEVIAVEIGTDDVIRCTLQKNENYYKILEKGAMLRHEETKLTTAIALLQNARIDTKKEARKFTRACPADGCIGFLNHVWHCGMCDKWTCNQCHEIKEDGHVCNPDMVETAKMMAKDTKPCPKCASFIFKIEGCDQMWCTQCGTAFSWRTGQVETGRIHNPHYYEYRRNKGTLPREIGDIPCGGMPTDYQLTNHYRTKWSAAPPVFYMNVIRLHWHIFNVVMPHFSTRNANNQDLRIKYMIKDISEDIFKRKIQQREKLNMKNSEVTNVLNTYQLISSELIQRVIQSESYTDADKISNEFVELRTYINELMTKISRSYLCVVPSLNDTYYIVTCRL